jgi:hypothetical protein
MRWASGSAGLEPSRGLAYDVGARAWAEAGTRLAAKPELDEGTSDGFVTAAFFSCAFDTRRGGFAGGGASEGGCTTSVWGSVEAGPECQVGFVGSARREGKGGRSFDPSCGAPSGVAIPTRYNPAVTKTRRADALMGLARVISLATSYLLQLSAFSHQLSALSDQVGRGNVESES